MTVGKSVRTVAQSVMNAAIWVLAVVPCGGRLPGWFQRITGGLASGGADPTPGTARVVAAPRRLWPPAPNPAPFAAPVTGCLTPPVALVAFTVPVVSVTVNVPPEPVTPPHRMDTASPLNATS